MTNMEFMEQLMTFSPYGGLVQAVVIEAISSYCEHVTSGEIDFGDDNGLINKEAWVGCCKDILQRIEDKYGPRPQG